MGRGFQTVIADDLVLPEYLSAPYARTRKKVTSDEDKIKATEQYKARFLVILPQALCCDTEK